MNGIKILIQIICLATICSIQSSCFHKSETRYGENPETGKYAEVNGIQLYFEMYGNGKPLVMLHGNGGSIEAFKNQIPFFERNFRVIAIDSRLHGKSGGSPDSLSYVQIADDVSSLLEHLKIDSAYVLGWSDGGIDGLILAMNHPEKVKALAVSGANIFSDSTSLPASDIKGMENIVSEKSTASERDKTLTRMMLYQPNLTYSDLTRKIKCSVLVMAGDRDIIKPEHTISIFQAIPKSELCVFPNSSHGALQEHSDLFNSTVENFFNRN